MDRNAFLVALGAGLAAQLILVVSGHFVGFVADYLFAIGGVTIAFAAGLFYGWKAPGSRPLLGGAAAAAIGAFVGILVSAVLADVPWVILLSGTMAAALAGLAGAGLGLALATRNARG